MEQSLALKPFDNFKVLDGYHCVTNSLAKLYNFHNSALSEEMLFGLGAGMGFIYWYQKGSMPILGGRANPKNFYQDLGKRTGVLIEQHTTTSPTKAEKELLTMLLRREPVLVQGDMGYLPCFDFGTEYHFGGHTFVICGYDGANKVLASDMEPEAPYLKKGFIYEMSLAQLAKARNSKYKPFPPNNAYLSLDFQKFRIPGPDDIQTAIAQVTDGMLNPPIANVGIKGISKAATEILKWPKLFTIEELRNNLFHIYIFIHIGGTGSGIFRYMYGRFLEEAAVITGNQELNKTAGMLKKCGDLWTDLALMLKDALELEKLDDLIINTSDQLRTIADKEFKVFQFLKGTFI